MKVTCFPNIEYSLIKTKRAFKDIVTNDFNENGLIFLKLLIREQQIMGNKDNDPPKKSHCYDGNTFVLLKSMCQILILDILLVKIIKSELE